MRETKKCRKGFSAAGTDEFAWKHDFETVESNESRRGAAPGLEVENFEFPVQNGLASISAEDLAQPRQAINEPAHLFSEQSEHFQSSEPGSLNESEGEVVLFADQPNQELQSTSDLIPELIFQPFNPVHPTLHQGTIDPRPVIQPFQDLLESLRPQRFSLQPSFDINMAIVRGRGRNYRTCGPNRQERARSRVLNEQEQNVQIQVQRQHNIEGTSTLHDEASDIDLENFEPYFNGVLGLVDSIEGGRRSQQSCVDNELQPHDTATEDVPTISNLLDGSLASQSRKSRNDDEGSEYQENENGNCEASALPAVAKRYQETTNRRGEKKKSSPKPAMSRRTKGAQLNHGKVQKVKGQPKKNLSNKKWTDSEGAALCAILQQIRKEDHQNGRKTTVDDMFAEASRRLEFCNIFKGGGTRAYWNRTGREKFHFDERVRPKPDRLAVGKQEYRSKIGRERIAAREAEAASRAGGGDVQPAEPTKQGTRKRKAAAMETTKEEPVQKPRKKRHGQRQPSEQQPVEQRPAEQRSTMRWSGARCPGEQFAEAQMTEGQLAGAQRHRELRAARERALWCTEQRRRPQIGQQTNMHAGMDSEELREARERVPSDELEDREGDCGEYHPQAKRRRCKD